VAQGCAEEAIAVAKASNVRLNVGDPIEHIRKLGGKIPDACPSMLLDYNAGRRCEVDAINGAIPRLGKPLGIATPVNETVVGIIRARERRMLASQSPNERFEKQDPPAEGRGAASIACADRDEVYETFRFSAELLPRFSTSSYSTT
jgi:2-dehydropantoate 2-reductase